MSSQEVLQQVIRAINALSNPQETQRANEWLVNFEKSMQAWEVADLCLMESASHLRFFGAKFIYSKIQRQFLTLDSSTAAALTHRLVEHILRFSQEPAMETNIFRYLSLSLAALALQLNQPGVINQILQWMNSIVMTRPAVLLILLTILPEEAVNKQIDAVGEIRTAFIDQLTTSSADVMNFLVALWPSVNVTDRCKVMKCAENWIDIVHSPAELFFNTAMYENCMQALQTADGELFESAVDLILAVIRRHYSNQSNLILERIFPTVLSKRMKWQDLLRKIQVEEELTDELRTEGFALSRLFTETAEYAMDIFSNLQYNYGQQELIAQLIECADLRLDHSISRIPLKFFYELSMMIKALTPGDPHSYSSNADSVHNAANPANRQLQEQKAQQLLDTYGNAYVRLVTIAVNATMMPDAVVMGAAPLSNEIGDIRLDWRETMLDCIDIIGAKACLDMLCQMLTEEIQKAGQNLQAVHWGRVESILLNLQIVAPSVAPEESVAVPQLISFVTHSTPKQITRLQVTIAELFGRFASWFEAHGSFVNDALVKLLGDVSDVSQPTLATPAAFSAMQILRFCSKLPNLPLAELNRHLSTMRASNSLSSEAEIHLLEGICTAATFLSPPEAEQIFRAVVYDIMQPFIAAVQQASASRGNNGHSSSDSSSSSANHGFSQHIERITAIFRFFRNHQQLVCAAFADLFPLLQVVLSVSLDNESVCEKVCRCYKFIVRGSSEYFAIHLPVLAEHLCAQFRQAHYSAFLYASSICIMTFGHVDDGKHVPLLYTMLWSLSETFFVVCNSLSTLESKPDLVEEYFFLVAKALQFCPAPFVQADAQATTIIQAGLTGLAIKHREAQKGILLFFERLVQLTNHWSDGTELRARVNHMIRQFGGMICDGLFKLLSGAMPAYAVDESNGCISDVLWLLRKRFEADFSVTILFPLFYSFVERSSLVNIIFWCAGLG